MDGEGNKDTYDLGFALDVPEKIYDIETGDVIYIFKNKYNISISVSPSTVCKEKILNLADKGFDVNSQNYWYYDWYITNLMHLARAKPSYKKLGFSDYKGNPSYFWDKIYTADGSFRSIYSGEANIAPRGTIKEWHEGIVTLVQGHSPLELVICCAFAALIMGFIGKEKAIDTTILNFWGNSSTGKSSAAKAAAAVFGSPQASDKAMIDSWFSTSNAVVGYLSNLYGVLRVIDDTSTAGKKDMEAMIYNLSNGKDKSRLNGDIQKVKSDTWRTLVMSTGEAPLIAPSFKLGASARVIEFNLSLTKSAEHAHKLSRFVNEQYGTAGLFFARKLLTSGKDTIIEKFDAKYDGLIAEMSDKPLNERLGKVYTLLLLACELANGYLKLSFNEKAIRDIILDVNDNRRSMDDIYEDILDQILSELSIRQNEISFADTYTRKNEKGKKIAYDKANKPYNKFIGRLDLRNQYGNPSMLIINRKVVDKIVDEILGYNQTERNSVYEYFKNEKYIYTYKDGYTKKCKIGNLRTPCFCFNVKIFLDGRHSQKHKRTSIELADTIRQYIEKGENENEFRNK